MLSLSVNSRCLIAGLLLLGSGMASVNASASTGDPQQLVIDTTDQMLGALKANRAELDQNPDLIYGLVKDIVLPHLDFVRMSSWVLGKHWRRASKEQKIRFVRAFRELMVRTYAVALLEYSDQKIEYVPLRDDPAGGDVTVRTQVIRSGKQPIAINYNLWRRKDEWKVYDIAVDGISLVANYRTSFASEIKDKGLDELITRLEQHNRQSGAAS
jgi:phospholipid transport system substrate-binding protein